jgi:hypothetical protein
MPRGYAPGGQPPPRSLQTTGAESDQGVQDDLMLMASVAEAAQSSSVQVLCQRWAVTDG